MNKINEFVFKNNDPEYIEYLEYNNLVSEFKNNIGRYFINYDDIDRMTFKHWKKIKEQIINYYSEHEQRIKNLDNYEDILRDGVHRIFLLKLEGLKYCTRRTQHLTSDLTKLRKDPSCARVNEIENLERDIRSLAEEYGHHEAWFENGDYE